MTEDYGILNENDLATYVGRVNSAPFSEKTSHGFDYWQCFPRDQVSVKFEDLGYSTEDHGWTDTLANMEFSIWIKKGVFHEYAMRRVWLVKDSIKDFNHWHKLMKGEKYICLNGYFVSREEEMRQGKKVIVYGWIFDKIKTKKGCAAYFDGDCDEKKNYFNKK